MYVIGVSDFSFLDITSRMLMNCCGFWDEVKKIVYDCDLRKATFFKNYEEATKIIEEIKNRKNEISFENNNILGQILDKKKDFDVDKLKIYQLVPTECKQTEK